MLGILIGSGENIPLNRLEKEINISDLVVAVDGGMNYLTQLDILPDLLIGDEDSINKISLDRIVKNNIKSLSFPREKDSTDMELALNYLYKQGCDELLIFGGIGSRIDHSLGNIFLLNRAYDLGMKARIIANNNEIILIDNNYTVSKSKDEYVSILPISTGGACVSLRGFKYPLDRYFIEYGSTIGISNEVLQAKGYIEVHEGRVLVFISKD